MHKLLKVKMLLLWMTLAAVTLPAQAAVTIDAGFTGTLVITYPDGEIALIEPGETLPGVIPNGSTIEVFDGMVSFATGPGDSVMASCFGSDVSVSGGSAGTLACGGEIGNLNLNGVDYPIRPGQVGNIAPPTADADPVGVPAGGDNQPGSRDIEADTSGSSPDSTSTQASVFS